jgi:large subunit ribosomal protein L22
MAIKKTFDATTLLKYTPRKARLIINALRGLTVKAAVDQLFVMNKGAAKDVYKLIKNATNNLGIQEQDYALFMIKEIVAEEAQRLYRIMPRARGSASKIRRRYSRVRVVIESKVAAK